MGKYTTRVEQDFIRRTLSAHAPPLTILDVGGGDGRHAELLVSLGHHPVIVEPDEHAIDALLSKRTNIPLVQGDAMALPVASRSFDGVLTIEVSICTSSFDGNSATYFADIARVLQKGGVFIFTAFNKNSFYRILRRLRRNKPWYERYYYTDSVRDYRRQLDEAGFDVVCIRGFRWPPFERVSNNRLVAAAEFLESLFMLRYVTAFSPWLYIAARKR